MAFAPYATLPEFKAWVALPDTIDDVVATSVLEAVSMWIDEYTDTHFWQDGSTAALNLPGTSGSNASTSVSGPAITGDIDVRADITPNDWTPAAAMSILAKWATGGNQRAFLFQIDPAGTLTLSWSTTGSGSQSVTSTVPVGATGGTRLGVRATLDVDDSAGNRVAKFYTTPTLGGVWTQLGATVTVAGTTSIFGGSAVLEVGSQDSGTAGLFAGKVQGVEVRDGIDGTVVRNPRFNELPEGTLTFTDSTGTVWTVNGNASITGSPATRTYSPCDVGCRCIDIDDLVSITSLKTDQSGDGVFETTWSASDYQLQPVNRPTGHPYTKIEAVGSLTFPVRTAPGSTANRIEITGAWGWLAVPAPVHLACLIQSSRELKRRFSPEGVAGFGEFGLVRISSRKLDPDVELMLTEYTRTARTTGVLVA